MAFVDGRNIYVMESSQDHKPIGDGDTGPNTGGMGAYSPAPVVTESMMEQITREILVPVVNGMKLIMKISGMIAPSLAVIILKKLKIRYRKATRSVSIILAHVLEFPTRLLIIQNFILTMGIIVQCQKQNVFIFCNA